MYHNQRNCSSKYQFGQQFSHNKKCRIDGSIMGFLRIYHEFYMLYSWMRWCRAGGVYFSSLTGKKGWSNPALMVLDVWCNVCGWGKGRIMGHRQQGNDMIGFGHSYPFIWFCYIFLSIVTLINTIQTFLVCYFSNSLILSARKTARLLSNYNQDSR